MQVRVNFLLVYFWHWLDGVSELPQLFLYCDFSAFPKLTLINVFLDPFVLDFRHWFVILRIVDTNEIINIHFKFFMDM